jgi:hypothetical protein
MLSAFPRFSETCRKAVSSASFVVKQLDCEETVEVGWGLPNKP